MTIAETETGIEPPPKKSLLRRSVPVVIGLVCVGVTFGYILPKVANYGDVWRTIQTLTWKEVALLAALTVLNIITFAPPYMAALPGLRFVPALVVTQASTASTYVAPGGAAVGMGISFAMLRAWRFDPADVTLAVTLTGIWNQFVIFGAPAVALGLLTLEGTRQHGLLLLSGLIGLVIVILGAGAFAAALSSTQLAHWVGDRAARVASWALRLARRGPVGWDGDALSRFRDQALALLGRRWLGLTLATIAGQGTTFFLLLASLRSLGVSNETVNWIEVFGAWSVSRLIGSLPFMPPGGIGVVELGLTGLLIGFGGGSAKVAAAVLLYRFLTIVPTLVVGTVAGLTWKRHRPVIEPA